MPLTHLLPLLSLGRRGWSYWSEHRLPRPSYQGMGNTASLLSCASHLRGENTPGSGPQVGPSHSPPDLCLLVTERLRWTPTHHQRPGQMDQIWQDSKPKSARRERDSIKLLESYSSTIYHLKNFHPQYSIVKNQESQVGFMLFG